MNKKNLIKSGFLKNLLFEIENGIENLTFQISKILKVLKRSILFCAAIETLQFSTNPEIL